MKAHQKEKGFTIIEVVLVLAIAALIFLMVFIALPALQRSQRDTQRKNDLSRATTAITNYTSANRGALPTLDDTFISQYLTTAGDTFIDPSGANSSQSGVTTYQFASDTNTLSGSFSSNGSSPNQNVIYSAPGYTCDTGGAVKAAGSRSVALRMYLEGGGVACENN
jgi:prepilin-type N-terminal cleavage/methylation domain-containing protein